MAKAEINVKILTISEEELRKIIQEEIKKAVEPGAVRPPYISPYQPRIPYIGDVPSYPQWWQNPVVCNTTPTIKSGRTF